MSLGPKSDRFNPSNKELSAHVVSCWLRRYGVNDVSVTEDVLNMLRKALVHRSYSSRKKRTSTEEVCNERLEFLGDSVLALCTGAYVFERFAGQNEGFMTRMRTKLVNGDTVSTFARHLKLGEWVCMSREVEERTGRDNKATLEDAFEAWLGALFVAFGFAIVQRWMTTFLETHVDFADLISQKHDFKDQLVNHFRAVHRCLPTFSTSKAKQGVFTVSISDKRGFLVASAHASSCKEAESMACRKALKYLGLTGAYGAC